MFRVISGDMSFRPFKTLFERDTDFERVPTWAVLGLLILQQKVTI